MGARVLVVDDDPWILRMVTATLEKRRFVVDTARDGRQALQRAQAVKPDVIVTDVMMPVMDGWTFVQQLRSIPHLASIPVIFLTALGKDEARLRALGLGPKDYLSKPFRFDALEKRVSGALAAAQAAMGDPGSGLGPLPGPDPGSAVGPLPANPGYPDPGSQVGPMPGPGPGYPGQYPGGAPPAGPPPATPGGPPPAGTQGYPYGQQPGFGAPFPGQPGAAPPAQPYPPQSQPGPPPAGYPGGSPHGPPPTEAPGAAGPPAADPLDPSASSSSVSIPAAKKRNTALNGRLEQLGLSSLLVMMEMERKDGVLTLKDADVGTIGRIFLRAGQVVCAKLDGTDDSEGRNNMYKMLAWTAGTFSFSAMEVDMEDTIKSSTTHLLMEGARLIDEANRP